MAVADHLIAMAILCGSVGTHGGARRLNYHSGSRKNVDAEFSMHKLWQLQTTLLPWLFLVALWAPTVVIGGRMITLKREKLWLFRIHIKLWLLQTI